MKDKIAKLIRRQLEVRSIDNEKGISARGENQYLTRGLYVGTRRAHTCTSAYPEGAQVRSSPIGTSIDSIEF